MEKELKYKMDIAYKENQLGRDLGFFEKQRLYHDEHSLVPEFVYDANVMAAEILVPATKSLMMLENNGGPIDVTALESLDENYAIDIEE